MEKYSDIDFAKVDIERQKRRGYQEAVFCECKTSKQLVEIFAKFVEAGQNVIGTRASFEQFEAVRKEFCDVKYDSCSKILTLELKKTEKIGEVAICTAGTGDIPIAQEAALVAEFYGSYVKRYYDIGIAGLHRLLDNIDEIKKANVIVVAAGMEGALGGIITGLVDVPVIALPTSVGYGLFGLSSLITMLNSCAEGMCVVNVDNGFNAGYSANQINRLIAKGKKQ